MRSQRTTKIPIKFDDSVHSINNTRTNKKKNVSKNKGRDTGSKSVGCGDNRDDEISDMMGVDIEVLDIIKNCEGTSVDECTEGCDENDGTGDKVEELMKQCNAQNSEMDKSKEMSSNQDDDVGKKSFAEVFSASLTDNDRNLECIPTEIDENGIEVVVFDEIMVAKGCKRWDLTLCGFFVGYKMSVNELRYNLKRMWSRYGFKDIVDYCNGVFFMKFHNEEGLNNVVNSGPWMVNRKPLVVQKWSVDLKLDSTELDKVPLWVRLCNIPVEAWTVKGISALASRIGKPVVMDAVTASKCKQGIGMVRFARVLIEVNAKKEMVDNIEVVYKNKEGNVQCRKNVKVLYDWKPPVCMDCGVFGHTGSNCPKNETIKVNIDCDEKTEPMVQKVNTVVNKDGNDGFVEVRSKKNGGINYKMKRPNYRANPQSNKGGNNVKNVYQAKKKNQVEKEKSPVQTPMKEPEKSPKSVKSGKKWSVHNDILEAMKRSANKFSLFEKYDVNEQNELRDLKNMEIVDGFLNKKITPTEKDMNSWDADMITYYKLQMDKLVDKGEGNVEESEEEDVLEEINEIAKNMKENDVKGPSSSDKQKEVVNFIREEKLQICAVLETHLKSKRVDKICEKIYGRWNWIHNMRYCNKGCRILVGWNEDEVSVSVIHMARQFVLLEMKTRNNTKLYGSFIYAANGGIERKELWKDLEIYRRIVGKDPWFFSGDMNVTLNPNEHSVGGSNMSSDMKDFKNCVNKIEVEDINSSGLFFTWTKNLHKAREGSHTGILKKLDRIMGSEEFISRFNQAYAIFLPYIISDHCSTILVLPKCIQAKRKPFKFANFITEKEGFMPLVNTSWEGIEEGCNMFRVVKRMRNLKKPLKKLAWENGNVFENVKSLKDSVKEVQQKIDKDPHNKDLRSEEVDILKAYSEAMKEEELILYQKAKVKWLSVGDRNNAYFHKAIKSRQQRNRIDAVCDENGKRFEGSDVAEQFVMHFQKFLGESKEVEKINDMEILMQNKLSIEDAALMIREVSDEEIKCAMFKIEDNKAPGLDGFSAHFFKKAWSIVGKDVCLAVKDFFVTGKILREINSTLIALVPKMQTPQKVSDFIPIACCNVLYKCISKIITDRIKGCLDKLVSKNQSAFIPNRHIHDNIMLAQELFKGYDRKMGPKRVALKVDIQKAYDTVNWQFLEDILRGFGFHNRMVEWIMKCVTTTSFSVCVNGESCGYFKGGRGLRQGDPMSPYLFTLVMEILTLIIRRRVDMNRDFQYHYGCKRLKITNVCFADDLLMFCHADKCSIKERKEILDIMPFKVEKLPIRYLGVPLTSKRIRIKECKSLIDKVESRVFNWKNKCLSYAGRLMLVASILESIHVYWASVILLPEGVIKNINKILKDFLWNQNDGTKGRPKVAWKNVCRSKQKGGLGLKDLGVWNRAMIVKHMWHIVTDKESLWVKWVNTEKLNGKNFWEIEEDINDSWGWRNILKQREDVRSFLVSKMGDGNNTSLWFDNWSCIGPLNKFINYRAMYDGRLSAHLTVKDWMEQYNGNWPEEWTNRFPNLEDDVDWWKIVWFSQNIPKHAFIVWLAIEGKLTTQDKIRQWGSWDVMCCALCKNDAESHSHLFFECEYSKTFWSKVVDKVGMACNNYKLNEIVAGLSKKTNGNSIDSIIRRICFAASVYLVWQERNNRIFRDEKRNVEDLFGIFNDTLRMRLMSLKVKRSVAAITMASAQYLGVLLGMNSLGPFRLIRWPWEDLIDYRGSI
ncbi:RNA-directed DNA polymerase, eukaryota, reverse transcriptase zinc-binding domain protein [Tanacetum coccineum]